MVAENPLRGLPTGTPRSGLGGGDDDELFGEVFSSFHRVRDLLSYLDSLLRYADFR